MQKYGMVNKRVLKLCKSIKKNMQYSNYSVWDIGEWKKGIVFVHPCIGEEEKNEESVGDMLHYLSYL